jgi:DNA replication licensing factor MCM2
MSEAFARMHLRDHVRQDDIDHAISVTIKSFISTQKFTVKKQLTKVFDKYLDLDKDSFELLNHVLSELQKEHIRYHYYRNDKMPSLVEIDCQEFSMRARELNVFDLKPFYDSKLFKQTFRLDAGRDKIITK